ncbi:MAG: PAQR family membrane homeostasis protein TrhA [Jatrophihabitantaceae bacterium]
MAGTSSYAVPRDVAPALYDSRRDAHYPRPVLRGWMHLVWFAISLAIGGYLLGRTHGAKQITAFAIYAATVTGLFGTSALYHRGNWSPTANRRLQRADHVMIFVLIAGTATPEFLLAFPSTIGVPAVVAMWTVTLALAGTHLCWMDAPEKLIGGAFLALGWGAVAAIPAVWTRFGVAAAILVVVGGVLYTIGAICYHHRRPDPWPTVFGYHEVFNAYVCVAAACHYVAITAFLL